MYEATNLLSSSKNPTQGDIRLVFKGMFKKLDHYQRGDHHIQKKIASVIYDNFLNLLNQNNIQGVSYDELDRYLNSPVDNHTDSLVWWKFHEKDYPILSQIAKDYLAIQATSERAFSISGLTISKTRNRL